ncbi:MAG: M18 family aminopeptidase [Spirochaetaceae bacterium]|nr:M18 family aminopeptidase [Spirochaetaceae bacterium]
MKQESLELSEDLIDFIGASPSAFHCVLEIERRLKKAGFFPLEERDSWELKKGEKFYVVRNNSSLVAFILGKKPLWEGGFRIAGAHTDSPSLKIKNEGASVKGGLLRMSVEPYGGGINSTWFDRNLSLAGRVVVDDDKGGMKSCFIDLKEPVAIIMNQAIHMNRELNKGFEYNAQNHLQAVFTGVDKNCEDDPIQIFKTLVAERAGLDGEKIIHMELYLYDVQPGLINGMKQEFISSSRIDNLAMCHAIEQAVSHCSLSDETAVAVFFDNEEIGSRTLQGADSSFLRDILDRITMVTGGSLEDTFRSRAASFSISADGAHAHHPNFPDSHDPAYAPVINGGPVIKMSSSYKYSTTSETASEFKKLCKEALVPYQELVNRSDIPSGSTIGTISSALTGIKSVDVGSPMFAMHSIRETAGVLDHLYMTKVLKRFYCSD